MADFFGFLPKRLTLITLLIPCFRFFMGLVFADDLLACSSWGWGSLPEVPLLPVLMMSSATRTGGLRFMAM